MPASADLHHQSEPRQHHSGHDGPDEMIHDRSMVARFYMSGDLRAATGISRTHLDFYLREGIVEPTARTESGYLLFDDAERERLEAVIGWRQEGISLREIRQRLGRDVRPDPPAAAGSGDQ